MKTLAPIRLLRSRLSCVLMGVAALATPELSAAGEASRAEALLARAVGVPTSRVLEATEIEVDRDIAGVFGRFQHEGEEVAAVTPVSGDPGRWLGPADDLWFAGMVDLRAEGGLATGRRTPRRLSSAGLKRPALVLLTRHAEAVAPDPDPGSFGSARAGIRRETHLFLVELGPPMRLLVDLETDHRSEDGFGGHHVGGLALRQRDGKTFLEGVRQDRLPASRARCREPEPYAVGFELAESGFLELPVQRPLVPCG